MQENQTDEIILEDELEEESKWVQQLFTILIILIAVAGFTGLAWYGYNTYIDTEGTEQLPIIKADEEPTKVKPKDPGGMHIPNTDKSIYDSLSNSQDEELPKVERILPTPEEALDKKKIIEESNNSILEDAEPAIIKEPILNEDDFKDSKESFSKKAPAATSVFAAVADNAQKKEENQKELAENKQVQAVKEAPKEIVRKFSEKDFEVKSLENSFKIQLASFRSEKEGQKQWKLLKRNVKKAIGDHTHFIVKKDVPKVGIMYRLQLGPVKNESEARTLCNKLKSSNIDCFVVRPNSN